jgi:hypothetical protein
MKTITWTCVYRFKTNSIGHVYGFGVDGNALMVVCRKDPRFISGSAQIQNNLLFPIWLVCYAQ